MFGFPIDAGSRRLRHGATLLLCTTALAIAGAMPALAADLIDLTVAPHILASVDQDSFLQIIPPRPAEDISADRNAADRLRAAEDAKLAQAIGLEATAKAAVEVLRLRIESLRADSALAAQQGRSTERGNLDLPLRTAEGRLRVAEAVAAMRTAEKDLAQAVRAAAGAINRYYETELDLAQRRAARPTEAHPAQDAAALERWLRYQNDLQEIERKGLETLLLQIEKREEVLKKEQTLLGLRVELFEAQNAARAAKVR